MAKKTIRNSIIIVIVAACLFLAAVLFTIFLRGRMENERLKQHTDISFVMDTVVEQSAYGPNAEAAMSEAAHALALFEHRLSLFDEGSEIAFINENAGLEVAVSPETGDLIQRSLYLSAQSENSFAISIAPLTLAWGVTGDSPRVVPEEEREALLPLVNDANVLLQMGSTYSKDGDSYQEYTVKLLHPGMGLDLGGIAKGEACRVVEEIYYRHGVDSALLSIGGNVYARGTKPDGTPFRIGYRVPEQGSSAYIASFEMTNMTMAVSGGYERFFEEDGQSYIHIIDSRTGAPAESDVLQVGVLHRDGATADFYSTSLFVLGKEKTLEYMREGLACILLDYEGNLYVSASLRDSFEMYEPTAGNYNLVFIERSDIAA